jgi:hypothetical protein
MKTVVVPGVLGLLLLADFAHAQVPSPGPEHQRLAYWIGTWKVEAEAKESALGPAGKSSGTYTYEWFPGQYHVVWRSEMNTPSGKTSELAFFAYEPATKSYVYPLITSTGMTWLFRVTVEGNTWHFAGEQTLGGKPVRLRFDLTELSPSAYRYVVEVSVDGGPWITTEEAKATKVK